MTETFYRTGRCSIDHSTFGGVILPSDFDTGHSGSRNMASRIISSWNFDNWCKNNKGNNNYRIPKRRNKGND